MPPGVQVALPALVLGAAALLIWFAGAAGLRVGRPLAAAAGWLALASICLLWLPRRSLAEWSGPSLIPGARLILRLDAVSFAFALCVLIPAALLLTFQRRGWRESGAAALTVAAALLAVLADGILSTSLFWGTAATLLLVQLRADHLRATEVYWPALVAGWLALVWAGGALDVLSGTAVYTAVPVTAMTSALFLLILAAAMLGSGVLPWRPWTAEVWDRPRLYVGSLAVALLFPIGFYVLVRAYGADGGRWPSPWLNVLVGALAVLIALTSALRAQAATTRRQFLSEALPGLGGFALLALAVGTATGITAAVATLLTAAVVAALLPLLPEAAESRAAPLLLALLVGAPPAATFAARALVVQSGIEAGGGWGFLALAAALAWLLSFAAAARAGRLPAVGRGTEAGGSAAGAGVAALVLLAGGPLLGWLVAQVCLPATAEVVTVPPGAVAGGSIAVLTAAGAWPAVALGLPLLVLVLLPLLGGRSPRVAAAVEAPPPLLSPVWARPQARIWNRVRALRVPEQYRSLFNPRALEAAMGRGQPLLWAVLLLALAVAVNR
ncbi:MAG TPA: hypothetical protein VF160_06825 [Candidatus Dormibacteraeota bacterium]